MHNRKLLSLLAAALLMLAGCAAERDGGVSVLDPWVRAMPGGENAGPDRTAAYLSIANETEEALRLIGVRADGARATELHETAIEDGIMRMRQVEAIDIPPGAVVTLEPGGLHVMLLGLERRLAAGDSLSMSLLLDSGEEVAIRAPVRMPE